MEQKDTYYNYDVDKLELSLPYVDGSGNVCTVSALYDVDHNILKQNFKENENDNNPVILSYILHVTDNTYNTHDIEYKLKFKKYPHTVLFTDDIDDDIKIYNNVDTVLNCFSTYCVKNNEIKTYKPTIYNFLDTNGDIIVPPDSLYTQIDSTFSLPEYINGKKVSYTYLLNLNYIKLPFTYTTSDPQQTEYTYKTTLLLGPTACNYNKYNRDPYTFGPYGNTTYGTIDERFFKKIKVEKTNKPLDFSIIPTNYYENKLYSYTLTNRYNVCNINNLFKFNINNSYIYLSSYFSCKNYKLQTKTVPGFITKLTKNYLSKKYVIYEYNDNSYITQNLQHIQTNNHKIYKYCLQYNNDSNQYAYAFSSTSYSLPKLITDNNIYYEYDNTYNTYTYYNTYIKNFQIDNAYSINNIILHDSNGLKKCGGWFNENITGYISYSYSHITNNILNISYNTYTYQVNENPEEYYLNTQLCIINYNSDNTPIYSIYHNDGNNSDETNRTNEEILKDLLLDCFKIYVHYDNSIVLKNITNIFNIKYTLISKSELEQNTENYWDSLDINSYHFERLYEDEFLNILATGETFNGSFSLSLYDCCIISVSLNTNKNIVSDIYIVIYNILGLPNQYETSNDVSINESNTEESNTEELNTEEPDTEEPNKYIYSIKNNIIYIEYSELLNLLKDEEVIGTIIKFNGVDNDICKLISKTHNITYNSVDGNIPQNIDDKDYEIYKTKLHAYFNNALSVWCNVTVNNQYDGITCYKNGFYNLIYENFYDVKTTQDLDKTEVTKLNKYYETLDNTTSFTYNGIEYSNKHKYFKWYCDNIFLSIKSTYSYDILNFPDEDEDGGVISLGIKNNENFYIEEYTFDYSYTDTNNVTYNYTYTCLYKCNMYDSQTDMSTYFGNNIVINTYLYEKSSNLTKDKFYKRYIINDDTLSTINTFNYIDSIQEQFYRVYLNKLKYNDNIEYILPTDNNILKELYKTNKNIEFKQIIDNNDGETISEFNEDFIKLTLSGLNINLNRIYNITTINNVNYTRNKKMLFNLNSNNKYEIKLNNNYKLNTAILLYKYTDGTDEIYFYYINNKFYTLVENLSIIDGITVSYKEDGETGTMYFNQIAKTDNIIKGLYRITSSTVVTKEDIIIMPEQSEQAKQPVQKLSPSTQRPRPHRPPPIKVMYFINNPIPSIYDTVTVFHIFTGEIIKNYGEITEITYKQINNIDIIPLLYNEYDNGLSDDDKQLLIDTIEILNPTSINIDDYGTIE